MTTGSGKKTPKTQKSGKASTSRGRRKKVVDKAPSPALIDKEKMAAFFSAAGIDNPAAAPLKEPESSAVEVVKEVETKADKAVLAAAATIATVAEHDVPVKSEVPLEVVEASSVNDTGEVVPESDSGALESIDNQNDSEGETPMMTTPKVSGNGSGSGSFNMLSMFFILVVMALFWFYFISSTPLQKAAEVQVQQKQAEISVLTTKIQSLEAENSTLQNKLNILEKVMLKWKKEVKPAPVSTPVTVGKLPLKQSVIKAAPKVQAAVSPELKRDPSFDKAPIPFWRNMKPRGSLIKQPCKKVKPAVTTPALKVDSFSRAPKPFWLTPRVKPTTAKAEKEVVISAPPTLKCPCKAKRLSPGQDPVSAPALDSSFDKAPIPFWLKK